MPPAPSVRQSQAPPKSVARTCDTCRQRKIKCVTSPEDPDRPCEGCYKLSIDCTFDYVKKKPGRKNSFSPRNQQYPSQAQSQQPEVRSQSHPPAPRHARIFSDPAVPSIIEASTSPKVQTAPVVPQARGPLNNSPTLQVQVPHASAPSPAPLINPYALSTSNNTFLGAPSSSALPSFSLPSSSETKSDISMSAASSSDTFRPLSTVSTSFTLPSLETSAHKSDVDPANLSWLDSILEGAGSWGSTTNILSDVPEATMPIFSSDAAHLASLESQSPNFSLASASSAQDPLLHTSLSLKFHERQLEDVTTWANISHFISLYLQHLYPLLPLVHRPKFAEHMAMRRDLRDPDFRALLLSIVAFVISQVPTTRLVNDQFDIESLKKLQRQCYRACRTLQRTSHSPTSLTQVNTMIFETFYLLSVGLAHIAGARLGQAIQLAYSMGLHSDAKTESLGLDTIEIQLRRRTFWQLYATDKTRAISGLPMMINDFQGICSLPEAIDDEFITSQGYFFQPSTQLSVMVGFVAVSRVFRILSEIFFHHRCVTTGFKSVPADWSASIEARLHQMLGELPNEIMQPIINPTEMLRQVFAMQRANILITIAICKFALYDLRAALHDDDAQLKREKEAIAREMHSLLMGIPVEDLASNGESVRAKVFHIVTALCMQVPATDLNYDLVRDWCNMFFAISFVQMPPPQNPENLGLDSRAPTPPAPEAAKT